MEIATGQREERRLVEIIFPNMNLIDSKLTNAVQLLNLSKHKGFAHNGGALIIGPDKNIIIPIGDADGYSNSIIFPNIIPRHKMLLVEYRPDGTGGILTIDADGMPYANILGNSEVCQ